MTASRTLPSMPWPTLRANDLTAEVFLVTDLVVVRWDADSGPPTCNMDAATVRRLAAEGAFFGSHLATHRAIDGLSSSDLAAELLRSRMFIERWTGRPTTAFAAPFSVTDRRLGGLARGAAIRSASAADAGRRTSIAIPMTFRASRFAEIARSMTLLPPVEAVLE